jgi:AraC-like DNA-binding protein
MTVKDTKKTSILAIDCCEHTISAIKEAIDARLSSITSRNNINHTLKNQEIHLIIVGIASFPVRRFFLNRLRRFFPYIPLLFLRREKAEPFSAEERLRGEFLISDHDHLNDLEIIRDLRRIFPLRACEHLHRGGTYGVVRETMHIITENYSDPHLTLDWVAKKLPISPSKLSRVLNQQVGISFRQLLRQVRIQEAKLMLATHKYNVKEVAARTGFSDSHYFSRSFKEATGVNATEYEYSIEDLIFN